LDPERLESLLLRRDLLFRLKRKYGPTLEDVIDTGRRVRGELAELEGASEGLEALETRLAAERLELEAAASRLSRSRRTAARRLAEAVRGVLPGLGMEGARFEVRLQALPEPGEGGRETV